MNHRRDLRARRVALRHKFVSDSDCDACGCSPAYGIRRGGCNCIGVRIPGIAVYDRTSGVFPENPHRLLTGNRRIGFRCHTVPRFIQICILAGQHCKNHIELLIRNGVVRMESMIVKRAEQALRQNKFYVGRVPRAVIHIFDCTYCSGRIR